MSLLKNSSLFTPWRDPVTGVESHLLSQRIAPIQQSFYYTHTGFSDDGRYLWFYCAFPPGGDAYYGRQLGVIDFHDQTVRHYPETQFMDASPFVDGSTGEVYWTTGLEIWKRGPRPNDEAGRVAAFPNDLAKNRRPLRIATHLSLSADRRTFAIDALIGNECFVGDIPRDGSGEFSLWQQFTTCHNHAQFSPTDPDLMMIAQDGWHDAATGEKGSTTDRIWLIRRGEQARPALPGDPINSDLRGHEWWDANGRDIWFIDYRKGTEKFDLLTGAKTNVWPRGHTHSHCDATGRYIVGDVNPQKVRLDEWRVSFFNTLTGKEVDIVTDLPSLPYPRGRYHVHPHPRFCMNDRYICYTTNVLGAVDLALIPVDQLLERTA